MIEYENKLYKDKYYIAVYDSDNDTLLTVLENGNQLAEFLGISKSKYIYSSLWRIKNGDSHFMIDQLTGKIRYIYLFEDDPNDDESDLKI